MANAILLIDLLSKMALRFYETVTVLRRAQAEGRDVTDEELASASAAYDTKKAAILERLDNEEGGNG